MVTLGPSMLPKYINTRMPKSVKRFNCMLPTHLFQTGQQHTLNRSSYPNP
jgi:hypothetical protein